jgi:ABC-2 type transport system permease protein
MIFSLKRMNAIFKKDLKDLTKNIYVGTSLLMPVVLAFMYGKMDNIGIEAHYLIINLTLVAVAFFVQCALIAEEREKNTLRGLMLSPATIPEILSGKSLVSFLITLITIVLCAKLSGYEPTNMLLIGIAIIISSFFYLALGTLFGLLSRSVMEASVIMLPVMLVFGFGSFLELLIDKYPMLTFVKLLPNIQLIDFANKVQAGSGIGDVWSHLAIILAWFIGAAFCTVFVYKKREMDE